MLSITAQQITTQTKSLIVSTWPYQPITENAERLIASYATAYGKALVQVLESVQISGSIVLGGVSGPGGPLVGGLLTCTPGSITALDFALEQNYVPPEFSLQVNGKVYRGEYTIWLKAFTKNLSVCLQQAWSAWYPLWGLASFPCVNGGISTWIPPAPPIVPAPGPWIGGTVTVPVSFNLPGQGTSTSPAFDLFEQATVVRAKSTPVTVPIQGSSPFTVMLCDNPVSEKMFRCLAAAYTKIFGLVTSQITLSDPTTSSASGTATPPVGAVVGGVLPLLVLK